jgi:ribokinase
VTEVAVVGDALLDVSASPVGPIRPGADVPADVRVGAGGQGANLAVRLARRGIDVVLVCALGDDAAGALLRASLAADGVRLSAVPAGATGSVVVLVDGTGERTMLSDRRSFGLSAGRQLPPDVAWLMVSGYVLLEPEAIATARSLAETSARRVLVGCAVPRDAVPAWRGAAEALRPDLVILNRAEHAALAEGSELAAALVVTDAGGANASIGALTAAAEAPRGEPAVDSTGAGDAFAAALVAALSRAKWPPSRATLEASLAEAVAMAGAVAHTPGAQARVATERAGGPA